MDELSVALGCSQMERIEEILDKRAKIAGMYNCSPFIGRCLDKEGDLPITEDIGRGGQLLCHFLII